MWLSHPRVLGTIPQSDLLDGDIFQTWNPFLDVLTPEERADSKIVLSTFDTIRSLVTPDTRDTCERLEKLQGSGGIFYVGAYVNYEVPLLENAVKSAAKVARRLGVSLGLADGMAAKIEYGEALNPKLQRSSNLLQLLAATALVGCTRLLLQRSQVTVA
jgi:hypothetical protein